MTRGGRPNRTAAHTSARPPADLCFRLRLYREAAGLTQREAAEITGLSVPYISAFETGARIDSLKVRHLERLLAVYGVSLAQFFGDRDEPMTADEFHGPELPAIVKIEQALQTIPHDRARLILEFVQSRIARPRHLRLLRDEITRAAAIN